MVNRKHPYRTFPHRSALTSYLLSKQSHPAPKALLAPHHALGDSAGAAGPQLAGLVKRLGDVIHDNLEGRYQKPLCFRRQARPETEARIEIHHKRVQAIVYTITTYMTVSYHCVTTQGKKGSLRSRASLSQHHNITMSQCRNVAISQYHNPPGALCQARLLENQEGASANSVTYRTIRLRKALHETFSTPTSLAPTLFQLFQLFQRLWRYRPYQTWKIAPRCVTYSTQYTVCTVCTIV